MTYASTPFLLFLLVLFGIYYSVLKRTQWMVLLAASYLFYCSSGAKFAIFLIFTTTVVYLAGKRLGKQNQAYADYLAEHKNELSKEERKEYKIRTNRKKRRTLVAALIGVFGILAFLKYYNFLADNMDALFAGLGLGLRAPELSLLLPLGISFYTFQSAGYLIDVYRGKYPPQENVFKFALFVSFFPQILQGPISRYDQLGAQLYEPHRFDYVQVKFGAQLILWGFFKKLVIADRAAILVNTVLADWTGYSGFAMAFAVLIFMAQVYADFSGGMDISIGIAQCLGIEMVQNFRRPHFAQSISEYWRRWHITLGAWMKDYVLYPISLSKGFAKLGKKTRKWFGNYWGKQIPTCIAMGIVFLLVGIWHGAAWKYIMFGVYNGGLIILGIALTPILKRWNDGHHLVNTEVFSWKLFKILGTFFLVFIGKYFAMASGARQAFSMIGQTFSSLNPWVITDGTLVDMGLNTPNLCVLLLGIGIFFCVSLLQEKGYRLRECIARQNIAFRWTLYMVAIYAVLIFGMYGYGYDAASFIYQGY